MPPQWVDDSAGGRGDGTGVAVTRPALGSCVIGGLISLPSRPQLCRRCVPHGVGGAWISAKLESGSQRPLRSNFLSWASTAGDPTTTQVFYNPHLRRADQSYLSPAASRLRYGTCGVKLPADCSCKWPRR